ncbi:MAG: glycosyltransferase [Victivallaceae bacterium]|jgi:undecaprenyl-phosphate 4-deoxy-4-formamido-L-arabinose transferase
MSTKKPINSFSVVIPVYNEEACLDELISRCLAACEKTGKKFEIILIDDGSKDRSAEMISAAADKNPGKIVGCILNRNYGQHAAIMAGFSLVITDLAITIDADLQNPPEEIPRLVEHADKGGYDVIGTIRANRKDSMFRKTASFVVNKVAQKATGVKMKDYGCMLRAYRRPIVDAMLACNERSTFIPVLGNSFARETCELEVGHDERAVGESKYSLWKLINLQFNLLTCMTTFPLRLLSIIGGLVSGMGVLLAVWIVIMRCVHGDAYTQGGVFTLFAVLFFIAGFQLVGMGLLGEYIGRIYYDVRARPRYFVEKVVGRETK